MTEAAHRRAGAEPEPASIADFFDDMSATRNELFRANPVFDYEQQVRARSVLDALGARRGEVILDIGCGNARDILPMLGAGATIVGVDLSQGMIEQARLDLAAAGHHGVRLEVGDATRLDFGAATFDKVVCSEVIEHIPDADSAMREVQRVLKPGGLLVLSTPNRRSWYGFDRFVLFTRLFRRTWNHPFDNWRNRRQLDGLLVRNGFEVSRASTVCYLPGFLLTYFLPAFLQQWVVRVVTVIEPMARRLTPGLGYLLVVTAIKNDSTPPTLPPVVPPPPSTAAYR
jgi:ubiquinone/menaquinone biosynthesis C-methylase UbiE